MKERSSLIGLVFIAIFAAALGALIIFAPRLVELYSLFRGLPVVVGKCILAAFYFCSVPAAVALFCLWRLLWNIRCGLIFVPKNARLLSVISWCCLEVSLLTLAACYHYLPFGLVSVAMLFVFLIVRVVGSCMVVGTALKEENSLTI
ncbi:MAG: DUF2975 domain-containing protein [Oscillospiraceae bacterium]|nr:DUF2975 domain-containing protein [Oscillospiraceae bacterium]